MTRDKDFIRENYKLFARVKKNFYLNLAFALNANKLLNNKFVRFLNRNGSLNKLFYSDEALLILTDVLRCDSHREAFRETIEQELIKRLNKKSDEL